MKASITTRRLAAIQAKKEAREEVERMAEAALDELSDKIDISILYTLHTQFGFGLKRLIKFYKAWMEIYLLMKIKFEYDDNKAHYFAMDYNLKMDGIDFYKIFKPIQEEIIKKYKDKLK